MTISVHGQQLRLFQIQAAVFVAGKVFVILINLAAEIIDRWPAR